MTTAARTVADIARTTTFTEGVVVADAALYERHVEERAPACAGRLRAMAGGPAGPGR
ncbi:MAG TPA: hypothetical protein VFE59_14095 [Trebonia sp.]|nr:hypothetical protein [Trebonia sp.]